MAQKLAIYQGGMQQRSSARAEIMHRTCDNGAVLETLVSMRAKKRDTLMFGMEMVR